MSGGISGLRGYICVIAGYSPVSCISEHEVAGNLLGRSFGMAWHDEFACKNKMIRAGVKWLIAHAFRI